MKNKIQKLTETAIIPQYATTGAACFDLHAAEGGTVEARGCGAFKTGLALEIPAGHAMMIYSRSGHGFKNGLRLANCVGVIDSDYRGEVEVKLQNDSNIAFSFEPGDRIAQAMVIPVVKVEFEESTELSTTERGAGGFGSTGGTGGLGGTGGAVMNLGASIYEAEEAAAILRCSVKTVEEHARTGNLPGLKFGDGWIFPVEALLARVNELALEQAQGRRQKRLPSADPVARQLKIVESNKQKTRKRSGMPDMTKLTAVQVAA
jgi:dUTP pyrophosphatase